MKLQLPDRMLQAGEPVAALQQFCSVSMRRRRAIFVQEAGRPALAARRSRA
jgi:hypothetical protein